MGEGFRGEIYPNHSERISDIEAREHLDEMNELLSGLIEKGGDLSSNLKHGLRAQIQSHLDVLGISSLEDFVGLTAISQRLHEIKQDLPSPLGYPDKESFRERLLRIYDHRGQEFVPKVPQAISAIDVARFGQGDWTQLESRGGIGVLDYLYNLGKIMSSEFAYTTVFDDTDPIEVGDLWRIENGRHRSLALRALGAAYVEQQGVDQYIEVRREVYPPLPTC